MTAILLPVMPQQFFDNDGDPLSNGEVLYCIPGTMTPKNTWEDADQTTLQDNPVTLNAAGRPDNDSSIYGVGVYRQIVMDEDGNTISDTLVGEPEQEADIVFHLDNAGSALTTGTKFYIPVTYPFNITSVTLVGERSASIVIDIWIDELVDGVPTDADSITGATPPSLSSQQTYNDTVLVGWTTEFEGTPGNPILIGINIDSVSGGLLWADLTLGVTKG